MWRLTGVVQPYAWGSRTAIPDLLGRAADGAPQAELWLGAHPSGSAMVDDRPLSDLISADPAGVLGAEPVERFGPRLPYLLKILAADQPLSLQAHPSREQAQAGYAREAAAGVEPGRRLYRDDWPKPEMLCPLGEMDVLCGFREPSRTYALFAQLDVPDALALVAPLVEGGAEELRVVFGRLLRLTEADHGVVAQVVAAAAEASSDDPELAQFASTAVELDQFHPGDAGVLAALLMNRLRLAPGQALHLPAGNLHAYLRGVGVEIMANSDNVLRGGLTKKPVAVEELLRLLDFTPGMPELVVAVEEQPGVWRYPTPEPEFALWRAELDDGEREVPATSYGRVLLTTAGRAVLTGDGEQLVLGRGQAAFAPAGKKVGVSGPGTVFVAAPGLV